MKIFGWGAAALAADPEKLVWIPNRTMVSIPLSFIGGKYDVDLLEEFYIEPLVRALAGIIEKKYIDQAMGAWKRYGP